MSQNKIDQLDKDRFRFLEKAYEISKGSLSNWFAFEYEGFGKNFDWDEEYYEAIYQYLNTKGLITNERLTLPGIEVVERAHRRPDEPTKHFPAPKVVNNHYHISGNPQSVIQTGDGNHASLKVYSQPEKGPYETVLPLLHQFLKELDGERELRAELEAETKLLEAQLKSPKPKFLKEIGKSIRSILEGVAVQAVSASPVYAELMSLLLKV